MNKRQKKKLANRRYEVIDDDGHFFSIGKIVVRGTRSSWSSKFHNYLDKEGLSQTLGKYQVKRTYKTSL